MAFLNFLYKPKNELEKGGRVFSDESNGAEEEKSCPNCRKKLKKSFLREKNDVCACGYHFRMNARDRVFLITDEGTFSELFSEMEGEDPLSFPGYQNKLKTVSAVSGEREAVVCGEACIENQKCCLFVMEPNFMMGSMGCAVGEKITRLFEYATEKRLPVVGYAVSGGARMQEGLLSLMQMAKTSGAVKKHSDAGLFYLTVLTDPTTGGVTASFAMEGDVILAEPHAMVGFAGARVIEQTTGKPLPQGFQTAEFLLEHGFVDAIIARAEQKSRIGKLLQFHGGEK